MTITLDTEHAAALLHDTYTIIDVNEKFLHLFRCERDQVIGLQIIELIADPGLRGLGKMRMKVLRETGRVPESVEYEFLRFDGTAFRGTGHTTRTSEEGVYKSTIMPDLGEIYESRKA